MTYKTYPHNPPHLFKNHSIYFITAGTYQKKHILNNPPNKSVLRENLHLFIKEFDIQQIAWVILSNHYHLLLKIKQSDLLPLFFRKVHSCAAKKLNQIDHTPGRKVWWNYWDKCIENEEDYFTRLAYIFWNPVKHGYVTRPEDYEFSNYKEYLLSLEENRKVYLTRMGLQNELYREDVF